MDVHRINGLKFNFETLTENELENIHGHLLEGHARIVGEIALVEETLFARRHEQLPLEESRTADPETWQRFMDHTRGV